MQGSQKRWPQGSASGLRTASPASAAPAAPPDSLCRKFSRGALEAASDLLLPPPPLALLLPPLASALLPLLLPTLLPDLPTLPASASGVKSSRQTGHDCALHEAFSATCT